MAESRNTVTTLLHGWRRGDRSSAGERGEKDMSKKTSIMRRAGSTCMGVVLCGFCCHLFAALPQGWYIGGEPTPLDYDIRSDASVTLSGKPSVLLKHDQPTGFATLMQDFIADHYKGKRVRFSGYVRSDQVEGWAGLWMRVDAGRQVRGFDNMQNRPIIGTSNWTQYSVVLDVPEGASGIFFGIILAGKGMVWFSGAKFEVVYDNTPVTGISIGSEPKNLDFEAQ